MVLNTKFWSLPVHSYQKQSFLMIILAVRGQGKNLVFDRNFIVKNENLKILTKTHVIYLKRKLRTCKMQIQVEKVWFVTKKMEKFNFEKKNFKGGTLWCRNGRKFFFPFFKISKFFFEKWLQWDVANVDRNKVMKFELISSIHWEITRDHLPGGFGGPPPPPCRIGLINGEGRKILEN